MKVLKYLLFFIVVNFITIATVNAAKWSDMSDNMKSSYKIYADTDKVDKISEVCAYTQANKDNEDGRYDSHYLFIYDDGTASIGWSGSGCERTNNGHCADGYKKKNSTMQRGVRNWSKNSSYTNNGLISNLTDSNDAYKAYESSKTCPSFMGKHINWQSNSFYLSIGSRSGDFDNVKSWAQKDKQLLEMGTKNDYYYNFPLVSEELPNITEDLTCKYEYDEKEIFSLKITDNGAMSSTKIGSKLYDGGDDWDVKDIKISTSMRSMVYLSAIEENKCPGVVIGCLHYQFAFFDTNNRDIQLTGDQTIEYDDYCKGNKQLSFKCVGDNCSEKAICLLYDELRDELNTILDEYKAAEGISAKTKVLNTYNKKKDIFNSFCKSTLANMDYTEGTCVSQCIEGNHELAVMETSAGMRSPVEKIKCNIGETVLTMVYNILKWFKYIAPAIVIILSILDFIKAIAAQSDDDMKKAQGKFVKRLIVAALLFLLPLIINFMLKTFGMYSEQCDITDLFS